MAILIFKLNGVPEDEADEVRALFDARQIAYYETDAGRWGISVAGIWLKDSDQLALARQLLDTYQQERQAKAQADYAARRNNGRVEGVIDRLRQAPLRFLFYAALIAGILYLSLLPFLRPW